MDTIDKIKAEIERRMAEFSERERTAETKQGKVACHHAYAALYDFKYFVNALAPTRDVHGWVAKDYDGNVHFFTDKPSRDTDFLMFLTLDDNRIVLPFNPFPELTWDNSPMEVEISIRKKYE